MLNLLNVHLNQAVKTEGQQTRSSPQVDITNAFNMCVVVMDSENHKVKLSTSIHSNVAANIMMNDGEFSDLEMGSNMGTVFSTGTVQHFFAMLMDAFQVRETQLQLSA